MTGAERVTHGGPAGDLAGRTVVVTGGTGFLGGYVCRVLSAGGADVVATGRADYDLTEQQAVRALYRELAPSVVVHAGAAVGGIAANVAEPGRFLYQNAVMGLMLLEEGRRHGLERLVLVSTTCTYPQDAPLPLREDDLWAGPPTGATGPYGMAKRLLHEACATYERQYGFRSAVLLLSNLYGPGDHFGTDAGHVIPSLVARYVQAHRVGSGTVTNWGSGNATREFLHVADAARAVGLAAGRDTPAVPINIGTGVETPIREVARLVQEAVGYSGRVTWDTNRPEGQPRRYLDVSRAQDLLDFRACTSLEDGIRQTVQWYLDTD